ncbi:MAG: hypothetical protein ACREJ9_18350 [Candidatus Rokuibacteriota bacterium]
MRRKRRVALTAWAMALAAVAPVVAPPPLEIHHIHGLALDRRDPEILCIATHTGLVRLRPGERPNGWASTASISWGSRPIPVTRRRSSPAVILPTYARERVGNLGLLVSRDGGRSWQSVPLGGEADFHALTLSPRDGGQLYGWSVAGQPGTVPHRNRHVAG